MIDSAPDHTRKPFHSSRVPVVCWCGKRFTLSSSEARKYEKLGYGASCCNSHGKEASRKRREANDVTGHKGYAARREHQQRYHVCRQGRASKWYPTYPVDTAIKKAGLA